MSDARTERPPTAQPEAVPERVGRRYRVDAFVAAGAMGVVYRGYDERTGDPVAIKFAARHADLRRFARESRALARIAHPRVVGYRAHGEGPDRRPFLVMEWLEGETLASRLSRGPLSLSRALELGHQIAEGLAALHADGIVHRDVKPANVLLLSGAQLDVKLLDFGLARSVAWAETVSRGLAGTPFYMAPEQMLGEEDVRPSADVFALGCCLFECITGTRAFGGDVTVGTVARLLLGRTPRARAHDPSVPEAVDHLLERMLQLEPSRRLADGAAAVAALAALRRELGGASASRATEAPSAPVRSSREPAGAERELRIKGFAIRAFFAVLDDVGERGLEARVRARVPDELSRAMRYGEIVSGGWYPIGWYRELHAIAREESRRGPDLAREIGRETTRRDLRGILGFVGKLLTPATVMPQAQRILRFYVDGGTVAAHALSPSEIVADYRQLHGFDQSLREEYVGGSEAVLRACGGRDVRATILDQSETSMVVRYEHGADGSSR